MANFHKLSIKRIIKETIDTVSIEFTVPTSLQESFSFFAGQYITLKTVINGEEIRRAYSICSSPSSNILKVAVKAIENGKFSTYATSVLQEGDVLDVSVPEGNFVFIPSFGKNYLGFVAGSGITPVISMVKDVLEKTSANFVLVYGNKSVADTIFYTELNALEKQYPNRLHLHYIFSRENIESALFGRIDKGHINYIVKNKYKESSFTEVFVCGPEEMINTVSSTLKENDLPEEKISFELFTASSTSSENTIEIKEGKSEITILLDDEETTFSMQQSDTILAASLRNKLDPSYSCQGGVCTSCIAKVTEGKAVMSKNSVLTDKELQEGLVLTCVAHPTTSKITIDFDEVG
jgi:ring-1,2-phenylacetyl-CoA epoxidase subunit PaaE